MKKSRYIFLGLAMILMLAGCGANRKTIRFGAAGIGGMYDSFANAYVSLANKEDFSYKLETRNTAGSAANVRLLSGKYIELGIAQADLVEEAYHGTGEFRDKAYQGYKAVAALYPEACQIIVRTDSEIETLDDLLGKTISIGAEESGTERNANQILQAQGISGDMVKTVNLDYTEAAAKLATKNMPVNRDNSFGGGAGAGIKITPVAFLVIRGENVRMLPVAEPASTSVDRLIELLPDLLEKGEAYFAEKKAAKEAEKAAEDA